VIFLAQRSRGLVQVHSSRPLPQIREDGAIHASKCAFTHHVPIIDRPTANLRVELIDPVGGRHAMCVVDDSSDALQEGPNILTAATATMGRDGITMIASSPSGIHYLSQRVLQTTTMLERLCPVVEWKQILAVTKAVLFRLRKSPFSYRVKNLLRGRWQRQNRWLASRRRF